jgi:hypothetical protein
VVDVFKANLKMGEASFSETMILTYQFILYMLKKRGIFNTTVGTSHLAE